MQEHTSHFLKLPRVRPKEVKQSILGESKEDDQ